MPLFDAYGRPLPDVSRVDAQRIKAERAFSYIRSAWRHLKPVWRRTIKTIASIITLTTVALALLALRQGISVEPGAFYDSTDPFSQRFVITNEGPLSVNDVHYACAVTYLQTGIESLDANTARFITVMLPVGPNIAEIGYQEKTSTDCDFLARFGPELKGVRIEIIVFYKRFPLPIHLHSRGFKFSAKRDESQHFIWDYGSPDRGPFDSTDSKARQRAAIIMPFLMSPTPCYTEAIGNTMLENAKEIRKAGQGNRYWIISTMVDRKPGCQSDP